MVKYLFLFLIAFSCNGPKADLGNTDSRLDSIEQKAKLQDLEITRLYAENDSLVNLCLSIQQEQRTTEYYLNQDFERLHSKMDSLSRLPGEKGKGWRILGQVFGEAAKRIIPGL
jgi:hypothetical protein